MIILKNWWFHSAPCSKLAPLSQGGHRKFIALNMRNFWPALYVGGSHNTSFQGSSLLFHAFSSETSRIAWGHHIVFHCLLFESRILQCPFLLFWLHFWLLFRVPLPTALPVLLPGTISGCTSGTTSGCTSGCSSGYYKVKKVYLCIPFSKQAVRWGPFFSLIFNIILWNVMYCYVSNSLYGVCIIFSL